MADKGAPTSCIAPPVASDQDQLRLIRGSGWLCPAAPHSRSAMLVFRPEPPLPESGSQGRDSSIRSNRMKALMPDDSRDPEDRLIDQTDPLAKKDKMLLDKTQRRYIPVTRPRQFPTRIRILLLWVSCTMHKPRARQARHSRPHSNPPVADQEWMQCPVRQCRGFHIRELSARDSR